MQKRNQSELNHLEEISKWKLEANEENTERHFYTPRQYERIISGDLCYVIGRKGSGKSAIAASINSLHEHDIFTANLSFKDFPFNILYTRDDKGFSTPSQYTTIWKFVILASVCSLMAKNEAISGPLVSDLRSAFSSNFSEALVGSARRSKGRNFSISIAEVIKVEFGIGDDSSDLRIDERVKKLELLVEKYIDHSKYFILFDELDEDYDDVLVSEIKKKYFDLLTGLFKAVAATRRSFGGELNIRPIVFLSDDIYDLTKNNDRNKWDDLKWELIWTPDTLTNMGVYPLRIGN